MPRFVGRKAADARLADLDRMTYQDWVRQCAELHEQHLAEGWWPDAHGVWWPAAVGCPFHVQGLPLSSPLDVVCTCAGSPDA
jgi:hypothetical protein